MNLVIDRGNSFIKYGLFECNQLQHFFACDEFSMPYIKNLVADYCVDAIIISSVKDDFKELLEPIKQLCQSTILFCLELQLPLAICYDTPLTLGGDRVAAAVGAFDMFPNTDVLVVDAGTAITYEYISSKNLYLGGNISPGLQTRLRSLNDYTSKLPLVRPSTVWGKIGGNTNDAICNGVHQGLLFEIEGYITSFIQEFPLGKVILTGGDSIFFENKLKNSIFASQHLVLCGLNRVLSDNVKK